MDNKRKVISLFLIIFVSCFSISNGCDMEGGIILPQLQTIRDVFRGNIYDRATDGIESIVSYNFDNRLNRGPYFTVTHDGSRFIIATNDAFNDYEKYETENRTTVTVSFSCSAGGTRLGMFLIDIVDTNNNHPSFTNEFTYTVPTPIPPGFIVTGCFDGITVQDIDLTTQKIQFTIEENPYFEVVYDSVASTKPKEFVGIIRTTNFIRNLPEEITLKVTATDVDYTNDPPLYATATVIFKRDTAFKFPEEPVFAQVFYFASYTEDHQFILVEQIFVQSGFDELVRFDLEGEFSGNFELIPVQNQVSIQTKIHLPAEVIRRKQIFLVVRADREDTSGDTATIIVTLPEEVPLQFEKTHYEGTIEINKLRVPPLILTQGYEGEVVNGKILGEYAKYFNTDIQENVVIISMDQISESIVSENNVISIEVEAYTEFSSARVVVTLEVIKDDNVTPVFNKPIYTGSYLTEAGLNLEQIVLEQGYDGIQELSLDGDHKTLFAINHDGPVVTLTTTGIPPAIFNQKRILLTLQATKPRTVGANTAIVITLPAALPVEFERAHYEGIIENAVLRISTLILTQGYAGQVVNVEPYGEYAHYFETTIQENAITLSMKSISDSVIDDNNIIYLEVLASTDFSSARTVVTLEIIKDDNVTPVFNKPMYTGSYLAETGLTIEQILLEQGYDGISDLSLEGDYKTLFTIKQEGPVVTLTTRGIPSTIFRQQRILLTIQATKPRTVGASTAIVITLPAEVSLEFERVHYEGTVENAILQVPPLILTQGYAGQIVNVEPVGEYAHYFETTIQENAITLSMKPISDSVIDDNNIIYLQIVASTEFTRARTVVTLEIIKDDNVTPVFNKPIYTGSYLTATGLALEQIVLDQGYDATVKFSLDGDHRTLFEINQEGPVVKLTTTGIPSAIFNQQRVLLTLHASKPRTVGANTAIVITLPPADSQTGDDVAFEKLFYEGFIQDGSIHHDAIRISEEIEVDLHGIYSSMFVVTVADRVVTVSASGTLTLPSDITHVVLALHAANARAVLILNVKQPDSRPEDDVSFDKLVYEGSIQTSSIEHERITISREVDVYLHGEHSNMFVVTVTDRVVTITASDTLRLPGDVARVVLELHAVNARAVLILNVKQSDSRPEDNVSFDQLIYEGLIQQSSVQHEIITISRQVDVYLHGVYSNLFAATVTDNTVTVSASSTLTLPDDLTRVILELHAANARAILVLNLKQPELLPEDDVSFDKLVYEGLIQSNSVQHETIIISKEVNVDIHGEYSSLFIATVSDKAVTVSASGTLGLPDDVTRVVLELRASNAKAFLVLNLNNPDTLPEDEVSFDKLLYEGLIQASSVQHERIIISKEVNVDLHGEYSSLFIATVSDSAVTVSASGTLGLPDDVAQVVLEIHASNAIAFLVLNVKQPDSRPEDDVSFDKLIYEGLIQQSSVQHEIITISRQVDVYLHGVYSNLFAAAVTDNTVTVSASSTLTLPDDLTHVILELHAANARAILVLNLKQPELLPEDDVSFDKLVYEGLIQSNSVQHETIIISKEVNVDIHGEYSSLFIATVSDKAVTVSASGTLGLPDDVTRVVLELRASNAKAFLVLNLNNPDTLPEDEVSFDKLLYEGLIQASSVQHERIIISKEVNVDLHGEYSSLFIATVSDSAVTVSASGTLGLPDDVAQVVLEIHASNAIAFLVLNVKQPDSRPEDDVSFDKLIYEGLIQQSSVQHELITISRQVDVYLHGVYSNLFAATVTDNTVTVSASSTLTLPDDLTHVILELHAANARAILVLNLKQPELLPEDDVSFDKLVYEGLIQSNSVQHETIIISKEVNVDIHGEYSSLFIATVSDKAVTVSASGTLGLPDDVTRVVLELRASNAKAFLVLNLNNPDTLPEDEVSFDKLLYEGLIQASSVQHERIIISKEVNVDLHGEYSSLFIATVSDSAVTVSASGTIGLPDDVAQVVLEIHASNAIAFLVLNVKQPDSRPEDDVSFDKLIYEGLIQQSSVQHEIITISRQVDVYLHGVYSNLFAATVTDNTVTVSASSTLTLPDDLTHVILELHAANARAILVLNLKQPELLPEDDVSFDKLVYEGLIQSNSVQHETIIISKEVNVDIHGEYSSLFIATVSDKAVTVSASGTLGLPDDVTRVVLELRASNAKAFLVLNLNNPDTLPEDEVSFDKLLYEGLIQASSVQHERIIISKEVNVDLHGEYSSLFIATVSDRAVTVSASGKLGLPDDVAQVVLEIHASNAIAFLVLNVKQPDSRPEDDVSFDKLIYEGLIQQSSVQHEIITISRQVDVYLHGVYSNLFAATVTDNTVTVSAASSTFTLPDDLTHVILELHAANARAILVLNLKQPELLPEDDVSFDKLVYEGLIQSNSVQHETIIISKEVNVDIHGEYSSLFIATVSDKAVTVSASGALGLPDDVTRVVLELHASNAKAFLVLNLNNPETLPEDEVSFDKLLYEGLIQASSVQHERIIISKEVNVDLHGEYSSLFIATVSDRAVTVSASGKLGLPDDVAQVVLEIHASNAIAFLVLNVKQPDSRPEDDVSFDKLIYEGLIQQSSVQHEIITISRQVDVYLHGIYSNLFAATVTDNTVTVSASSTFTLPDDLTRVTLELHAANARAILVLKVKPPDSQPEDEVSFDKIFYEGLIQPSSVQHETITISREVDVDLRGEYSNFFVATVSDRAVRVSASSTLALPDDVTRVVLELQAADARAVLILNVIQSDIPVLPTVTFSSPCYVLNVEAAQTGLLGRVLATADNGEALAYSLIIDDAHLLTRVSINNEGELHLSAPGNSGVYSFQVIATTINTQATGTATVHLTVQAMTIIEDDEIVMKPLIVLNRNEEEAHKDLVILKTSQREGCRFTLTNRWPPNQKWLYVDENGLHATSIDREDESIAFMALSQIQVELTLHCESNNVARTKRSPRADWLGPYNYGSNQWILAETIEYNPRKSLVNLIVNDINDNYPIFVGKEYEPIAVGYPITELEERILPRSLAELEATDADIGENAALLYWSSEDVLAVAPTTGFVHVRSGARLENNQQHVVYATDKNGEGHTGSIQLVVKLLRLDNIAVVTIKNAFLDNEKSILAQLSETIGYEVKVLRSVVVSDDHIDDDVTRQIRDTTASGASLLLYVYGLMQGEPVTVDRLIEDISNNAEVANVISTISLDDYLTPVETIVEQRDIGLFVATIVLSVLLFIIIALIAIWYFLKRRKSKNYEKFPDENSSASSVSIDQAKNLEASLPRLNIEELKRSEKRLQDMLNAPIQTVTVEPITSKKEMPTASIVDLPSPESNVPIVIQSIDKLKDSEEIEEDEFGKKVETRRKSVVTFNEKVEKIIHVESDTDSVSSTSNYEIFKL